jgi:hypothetical protein
MQPQFLELGSWQTLAVDTATRSAGTLKLHL